MKDFLIQKNKGFTLLEMLVAVFIFSISLAALATISSRGVAVADNAMNQTTAQFLAQEGIEMVQSRRDDNFLNPAATSWLDGLTVCENTAGCFAGAFDTQTSTNKRIIFNQCSSSDGCPLLVRTNSGLYWYGTFGDPTIFRRIITLTPGTNGTEDRIVRSRVEWTRNNTTFSVESQKVIFNWL